MKREDKPQKRKQQRSLHLVSLIEVRLAEFTLKKLLEKATDPPHVVKIVRLKLVLPSMDLTQELKAETEDVRTAASKRLVEEN